MFVELPMHDMVMADSQNVFRPGRSHAAMMLKMVIAHSFLDYDCTLDKGGGCAMALGYSPKGERQDKD